MLTDFRERIREGEREEGNMDGLPLIHTPLRDRTYNLGMCADHVTFQFRGQSSNQPRHTTPGQGSCCSFRQCLLSGSTDFLSPVVNNFVSPALTLPNPYPIFCL